MNLFTVSEVTCMVFEETSFQLFLTLCLNGLLYLSVKGKHLKGGFFLLFWHPILRLLSSSAFFFLVEVSDLDTPLKENSHVADDAHRSFALLILI